MISEWINGSWISWKSKIEDSGCNRFCSCVFLFDSPECFSRPEHTAFHILLEVVALMASAMLLCSPVVTGGLLTSFDIRCSSSVGTSDAPWNSMKTCCLCLSPLAGLSEELWIATATGFFPLLFFALPCVAAWSKKGQTPRDAVRSCTF